MFQETVREAKRLVSQYWTTLRALQNALVDEIAALCFNFSTKITFLL